MSDKIDSTLKKIAAGIPSGTPPTNKSALNKSRRATKAEQPQPVQPSDLQGDPNCPICHGLGLIREDLPVGHPDFGRVNICTCREGQVNQRVRQRLFALSNLDELGHLTFENFNAHGRVGLWPQQAASLEQAYNQAKYFAQNLKGWLLLQGGYGCGKTHLAAAIANFTVRLGVPTLFITVPDLLDTLRFAYQDPLATFEERFDQIRNAPLLVMDDFGTQNATAWAQEKLFQILNYRYINRLPLVVTTNLSLDEIEGRIRSRLDDPELVTSVHINAPDFRNPTGDIGHHELSSLALMHDKTFASFDLRQNEELALTELKSLERAFQAAKKFAEKPRGWIVFTGPYGGGKTHLAAAIANHRAESGTIFIVVPDLLDHLRATFNPNSSVSLDRRFEQIRTAPVLVLDDLGMQSMTPWVKEKLYQLFNYRYNAALPTVITTSAFIQEMDPRLLTRMQDTRICTIYALTAPAYHSSSTRKAGAKTKRSNTE